MFSLAEYGQCRFLNHRDTENTEDGEQPANQRFLLVNSVIFVVKIIPSAEIPFNH